jgi:hypothetical protein
MSSEKDESLEKLFSTRPATKPADRLAHRDPRHVIFDRQIALGGDGVILGQHVVGDRIAQQLLELEV